MEKIEKDVCEQHFLHLLKTEIGRLEIYWFINVPESVGHIGFHGTMNVILTTNIVLSLSF